MYCGINISLPKVISENFSSYNTDSKADIEIKESKDLLYSKSNVKWYHYWQISKNSSYLSLGKRIDGWYIFHFHLYDAAFAVSPNGKEIVYHTPTESGKGELRHLLLNQVIPLVMNHLGIEVLHASCVLSEYGAIAFAAEGGSGKSSIAASLIDVGMSLISDDAVPLFFEKNKIITKSGPPEMNLWPRSRELLGLRSEKSGKKEKIVTPLSKKQHVAGTFPLTKIYFLQPSLETENILIKPLSEREELLELLKIAHRLDITDEKMLKRQFDLLRLVAKEIPANILIYPRDIPDIISLRNSILNDIKYNFTRDNLSLSA